MKRDDDNVSKKQPWRCCVCRGTHKHRCYKCFCEKCPWYKKKVPPVFGMKDRADKLPSMGTSTKLQPAKASDPCAAEEYADGLSSNPSILRSSAPIGSGERADVVGDREKSAHPSTVKEQRGNREVMCRKARDGSEPVSRNPQVESDTRRSSHSGKRSQGDRDHGIEDRSSALMKKTRGPQEIVNNATKDRSSEAVLLKPHVNSGSYQDSESVKESRGVQEERADRTRDGSCKSISHDPPSRSYSRWDVDIVKDARGDVGSISRNAEVMTNRGGDGSGQALHNCSSGVALASKGLRGNVKVNADGAGDYCEEVLHNCHIHSGSRNQEIMAYRTEKGCYIPASHNPNAGLVSIPSSLSAKETTVSVSDKETDKDGQHDVKIPSNKLEGIVRVDKKYLHPTVASQHTKPPPVIKSGESYSTKGKLCSSQELAPVGPALELIWKGKFEVPDFPGDGISENFIAHSSAKVSHRAYNFASKLSDHLLFNLQPRPAFWPNKFQSKCPDNRDVALYFYPLRDPRPKKKYAKLLKLLEGQDLMLKSVMGGAELLIFSSTLLDSKFQKIEGSLYLWGVFHKIGSEKVASSTDVLSPGTCSSHG